MLNIKENYNENIFISLELGDNNKLVIFVGLCLIFCCLKFIICNLM